MSTWLWILIIVGACGLTACITALWVTRRNREKVAYMMDALEDGETNFRFRDNTALNRELNRIRGIMERQSRKDEDVSWGKLFRVITASSKELVRFVESYRSFTKSVPPVCKSVMVDELVGRVLRLHEPKTSQQGVSLTYRAAVPDLLVFVDEGQIMHVFNNLIKNAIEAEATTIAITADLDADERTVIRVSNNGRAIPLRKMEEIFVPFYTTKSNGTGVGLSLSRRIMAAHHGTLTLVQSDDAQTIFALVFA